ncbi:hypothetical protein WMF20_19810 [Sorangium sp. So ce834]
MVETQPMTSRRKKARHGFRGHPLATAIGFGPGDTRAIERGRDA